MAVYDKPPISNIPFSFSSTGYAKPDFGSVPFRFGLRPTTAQTADLRAAIDVMGLYQDSTYTYLKGCPKIVVGYTAHGIQTLQLPCEYGGIRDVGGSIFGELTHVNLGGYIFASASFLNLTSYIKSVVSTTVDLPAYIKQTYVDEEDLGSTVRMYGEGSYDLTHILRVWGSAQYNLPNTIRGWQRSITADLKSIIRGWSRENIVDLPAYLKQTTVDTKDLPSYLKQTTQYYTDLFSLLKAILYEVPVDLPGHIKLWFREQQLDLPGYLKQTYAGYIDLISKIKGRALAVPIDIPSYIHSWQEVELSASIGAVYYKDLGSTIGFQELLNLISYINPVQPVDLQGIIQAWHITDLQSVLTAVYGPGDIQASITPIPAAVLRAYISGYKGIQVPFDLRATIESYFARDLTSLISSISPADLGASITVTGSSEDMPGALYPKIVYVKRFIPVSLLEHRDLMGLVNITCFSSTYRDIGSYVRVQHASNLRGAIFGVYGNNIFNLGSIINTGEIETADTIEIHSHSYRKMVELPITFSMRSAPYTYDTLYIRYGNHASTLLSASIYGMPTYRDLSSSVTAVINADFSLLYDPSQIKHREIVINLLEGEPQWQREVELAFRQSVHDYYYFSGDSKVYRTDRDKKWSLRIEGFERITDGTIDRGKTRTKYLFSLSDYGTIDEGVRDLIDRVSMFRRVDLRSAITPSGGYKNLNSYITTLGYTAKSNKTLGSLLTGISSYMFDIQSNITGIT